MRLRAALLAVLVVAINCISTFAQAATILDTLGDFTTSDVVPLPGSFGQGVAETPQIGPLFILSVPTRITEIGAFLDSCASHLPGCEPDALFVDIHRSFFGVPDLSSVLGTFALPLDHDPLTTTYLSVDPQLVHAARRLLRAVSSPGRGEWGQFLAWRHWKSRLWQFLCG